MTLEARDDADRQLIDPADEQVHGMLDALDEQNTFLVLSRGAEVFQTLRLAEDAWVVEYLTGEPWYRFEFEARSRAVVAEVLDAWLHDVSGWRERYPWVLKEQEGKIERRLRRLFRRRS